VVTKGAPEAVIAASAAFREGHDRPGRKAACRHADPQGRARSTGEADRPGSSRRWLPARTPSLRGLECPRVRVCDAFGASSPAAVAAAAESPKPQRPKFPSRRPRPGFHAGVALTDASTLERDLTFEGVSSSATRPSPEWGTRSPNWQTRGSRSRSSPATNDLGRSPCCRPCRADRRRRAEPATKMRKNDPPSARRPRPQDHDLRAGRPRSETPGHSGPARVGPTWSATWATASTTPRPCTWPTWASASTTRPTWPGPRGTSSCWNPAWRHRPEEFTEGPSDVRQHPQIHPYGPSSNFGNMLSIGRRAPCSPLPAHAPGQIPAQQPDLPMRRRTALPPTNVDPDVEAEPAARFAGRHALEGRAYTDSGPWTPHLVRDSLSQYLRLPFETYAFSPAWRAIPSPLI